MKINPNVPGNIFGKKIENFDKKFDDKKSGKTESKVDTVSIHSEEKLSDAQFIERLTGQVLKEVENGAGNDKLQDLKRQVLLGEYDINPDDIVNKIFGSRK